MKFMSLMVGFLLLPFQMGPVSPRVDTKEDSGVVFVLPDRLDRIVPQVLSLEELVFQKAMEETRAQGLCVEFIPQALDAGWQPSELPRLMRIMFRESRCDPNACGATDSPHLRKCRDWGLMQINDYSWKTTIRRLGLNINQMTDPFWNLWFARWLFEYSLERNGDGWQPWKHPTK